MRGDEFLVERKGLKFGEVPRNGFYPDFLRSTKLLLPNLQSFYFDFEEMKVFRTDFRRNSSPFRLIL